MEIDTISDNLKSFSNCETMTDVIIAMHKNISGKVYIIFFYSEFTLVDWLFDFINSKDTTNFKRKKYVNSVHSYNPNYHDDYTTILLSWPTKLPIYFL